jgi:hypothetical protein
LPSDLAGLMSEEPLAPTVPNAVDDGLRDAEVKALVADGVLTNDWRGPGNAIAISEHELEALCTF